MRQDCLGCHGRVTCVATQGSACLSLNHVQLFEILCAVAHQAPLSMGFSRQEHWSGFPCPLPGNLPNPEIETASLKSPVLAGPHS